MRPTTRELVDGIANALERQVSPVVQDKWAASVLRSAMQLLRHVAVRVEDEARLLVDDNADAARTLEGAVRHLQPGPDSDALRSMIASALQAPAPAPYDAVQLAEHNERLQAAIEQLLRRQGAPARPTAAMSRRSGAARRDQGVSATPTGPRAASVLPGLQQSAVLRRAPAR